MYSRMCIWCQHQGQKSKVFFIKMLPFIFFNTYKMISVCNYDLFLTDYIFQDGFLLILAFCVIFTVIVGDEFCSSWWVFVILRLNLPMFIECLHPLSTAYSCAGTQVWGGGTLWTVLHSLPNIFQTFYFCLSSNYLAQNSGLTLILCR